MKLLFTGILSFLYYMSLGQCFSDNLLEHYSLTDTKLKAIELYVSKSASKSVKPLLVYIDGSGNFPICYKTKSGSYSTSVALDIAKYAKDYYVVLISKPGIPFSDSLRYTASGRKYYPENAAYKTLYSLDWRVEAASKAIDFLIEELPIDKKKVIVMGYSEGSQVAPKIAVLNKKVTNVVCFVGNALNQFYDFILEARLNADRNKLSSEEAQKVVDSLYIQYEKIYANPTETNQTWFGETYLKWSSFTKTTPLESMLSLNIPILYIAGGKDNNQTILSMDYAKLEFLRKGKKNLTYKVYPNCNHYFQEQTTTDESKSVKKTDRLDEVHQFAIEWTKIN